MTPLKVVMIVIATLIVLGFIAYGVADFISGMAAHPF